MSASSQSSISTPPKVRFPSQTLTKVIKGQIWTKCFHLIVTETSLKGKKKQNVDLAVLEEEIRKSEKSVGFSLWGP